ncbi:CatB-related O-acetyltransferase [Candidatus Dojkabacteria bacterium]|nr:CatB-related O-acetyltransferase [Candidatus Dojkabacteria bacterium]
MKILSKFKSKLLILKQKTKGNLVGFSSIINSKTKLEGSNKIFPKADVSNSHIGFGTYVGISSSIINSKVGRFCSIGPRVCVVCGRHPSKYFLSTHPAFFSVKEQAGFTYVSNQKFEENKKLESGFSVEIGNDVWIGAEAMILEGVKIGDGAVIAARALIYKDVEPYSINGGNPQKEIGFRFSPEEIKKIQKLDLWNRGIEWIKANADKFDDMNNFDAKGVINRKK